MTPQQAAADQGRVTVRYERGADGVVVLTLDDPAQSANTMNRAYVASMEAALDRLEAEREQVIGVIVTSAKTTFFAGGDLAEMVGIGPADAAATTAHVTRVKAPLRRLERLGRPVVAAVNGSALGGGLEIALACHHRIALDAPGSRLGFPEVTLGLLPGAGGVTRTVRMLGVADALTAVLLEGRRFSPREAQRIGLVEEVVHDPAQMLDRARTWIGEHPTAAQPWDTKGFRLPGGTPAAGPLAATLASFPANLRKRLKGSPMPAPYRILCAAVEGAQVDVDTALVVETRYLVELLTGQISTNMINAFFFDLNAVNAGASRPTGHPVRTATRVAVLGAGMMGAGIAYECARAGMQVLLKDVSVEAAARGKAYSERLLAKAVERGTSTAEQGRQVLDRITPTGRVADLAGCDLMIEAVFEEPGLKQSVYTETEPVLAPDALLASNTSTLPISTLAEGVSRPQDFIGMHFFSPVDKMPLVEIVVGRATGDAALARALDVARQIRKTPIVVNDSRGFYTSRVIGRFMDEALGMLAEGVPAASIEQAALQAGYPTGPLALTDEVSLTLAQRIRRQSQAGAPGDHPYQPAHAVVDRMVDEFARPGRAGGAGFYEYAPGGARLGLWAGLAEHFPVVPGPRVDLHELSERMLFAEAVDSVRCLEEGVLRTPTDGNIGSLLGIGFPAWTGGALRYVEQYDGGVEGFVDRARELAARHGDRFAPPQSLLARAVPVTG